jgi:hypothetical protein
MIRLVMPDRLFHQDCGDHCPRVARRMECPECGYPYSEARYALDLRIPHQGSRFCAIRDALYSLRRPLTNWLWERKQ